MSSTESSDMQLLEISRRTRKLVQMINSLFRVQNFDGRNKRIPGGSLLLEDALSVTTNAKEKKLEMGRKLGAEEGEQFGSCGHEEEVKKVIRESLLLSSREDEKASSSRSLRSYIRSGEFGSSFHKEEEEEEKEEAIKIKNPAKNSRRPEGKMATPNLIARLMGLEELPAREAATAAAKIKAERETPSASRDGAPQRVTLLSIIEREKAAKHDGSGFSDAKFCAKAMQIPLNSSRLMKNKIKIEHQRFRKVTEAPLPINYSVRSLAAKDSASPGKRATGVKPAQKIAKLKTSINEKAEGTSVEEDDAPVMDISPDPQEPALCDQHSSRSSNNEHVHSDKHPKTDCEIRPKPSQLGARRCPSDSIEDRLNDDANNRVAGEAKHLDNSLLDDCQLSSTIYEATSANNNSDADAEANLYLACARELLLRRRRYQELRAHRPRLSTGSSSSGRVLPTHDLAGGIGIREHSAVIGHGHGSERDLECEEDVTLNAVWDAGWRDGLGWEAAAEVVAQLEEMVLTDLMEEVTWVPK